MGAPAVAPPRLSRRVVVFVIAASLAAVAFDVGLWLSTPRASGGALPLPAGTVVQLSPGLGGFSASFNFSWGPGGYLEGAWASVANVAAFAMPRLSCDFCPFFRIYMSSGQTGSLNDSFGGDGNSYPNMSLTFRSGASASVWIVRPIRVVYPPLTTILAKGTQLAGTETKGYNFTVHSPGAFLTGAWTAVNTTFWPYPATTQWPTECAPWPADSPPLYYEDSLSGYLAPGNYTLSVDLCVGRPWTVTVTETIGIFYP